MTRRARPLAGRAAPWTQIDPERRNAILLYGGISLVVLFALALVAYGYYEDRIAPKHETVLTVAGRQFDYAALERRVIADLKAGALAQSNSVQQAVLRTLDNMEREELLRRAGPAKGINVTDEDVDIQIHAQVGLQLNAPRDVFASLYRQELLKSGLTNSEYRENVKAHLIEQKLQAQALDAIPAEAEQVDLRLIVLSTPDAAKAAKDRLDKGESFPAGQPGWVPRGALPSKVEDVLFSLPVGVNSEPIETPYGVYIVQARNKEVRPIDASGRNLVAKWTIEATIQETRDRVGSKISPISQDQIANIDKTVKALAGESATGG